MKMKNILKIAPIIGAIASSTLLSGCLQEPVGGIKIIDKFI